jgi:hypothetical protein
VQAALLIVVVITLPLSIFYVYISKTHKLVGTNSIVGFWKLHITTFTMASPITSLFAPAASQNFGRKDSTLEEVFAQLGNFKGFSGISTEGRSETPTYVFHISSHTTAFR